MDEIAVRAEGLDQAAAEFRVVLIDDGDRNVADELAEIGLRIEERVEDRREHEQAEHPPVAEHASPLRDEGAGDARPCAIGRLLLIR